MNLSKYFEEIAKAAYEGAGNFEAMSKAFEEASANNTNKETVDIENLESEVYKEC